MSKFIPTGTYDHVTPAGRILYSLGYNKYAVSLIFSPGFLFIQVGGATGVVGDPSGRSQEREGLSMETLEKNKLRLKENLERIFQNGNELINSQTYSLSRTPPLK